MKLQSNNLYFPNKPICPHCGIGVNFKILYVDSIDSGENYILLKCPNCEKVSLAECYFIPYGTSANKPYCVANIFPKAKFVSSFQKELIDISPSFIKIYEQAINAEMQGYDELVGMGLRKALDFLVTDYLNLVGITPKTNLKERIEQLGSDDNIRPVAHLANWIGNDYTHVETRNEDLTIADMKTYIQTVVYWMCAKYVSKKARELYVEKTNKP